MQAPLGIRWTVGDVSPAGYEALRISLHALVRLLGSDAQYVVCVNSISIDEARQRTGNHPPCVAWQRAPPDAPDFLRPFLSPGMAEGVAWKLLPPRLFHGCFELALDNDVILWQIPEAVREWLASGNGTACVVAADDTAAHGVFAELCGPAPRNSGIRGIAPAFDYDAALRAVLRRVPVPLRSELDEQGLQIAALSLHKPPFVVPVEDVSICSPFYPHSPELGRCGAHFIGLNARKIPWSYFGEPATKVRLAHWYGVQDEIYRRTGFTP